MAEYCISEGWVKVPAGKTVDRKGNPMLIKIKAAVMVIDPQLGAEASGAC